MAKPPAGAPAPSLPRAGSARRWLVPAVSAAVGATLVTHRRRLLDRRARLRWLAPVPPSMSLPLSARVIGDGPPIVLLHGLGASGRYWGSAYDQLGDRHRLVVPDLLGFGASPRPDHGYGPDEHAAAVAACLDAAGVSQPAVIGAHSAGVIVALRLALCRPELVRAVVAFGPPLYRNPRDARQHLKAMGGMARLFANDGRGAEVVCRWVCRHRRAAAGLAVVSRPDLPADIARDGVQHTWHSYSETLTGLVLKSDASNWLDQIEAPVVLIAGGRDATCDQEWLQTLAHRHRNVRFESWPGDHHLPLTDPDRALWAVEEADRLRSTR